MSALKAPFPWFGGKSRVESIVWDRFGDVDSYCEPFAGSLAVLLGRPAEHARRIETINDLDGYVANTWRAIAEAPDEVARWADWPVNEADLHARHVWLVEQRACLLDRLMGNPDWYDAKVAGWWLWGIACWIGSGWCSGRGPWQRVEVAPGDWRFEKRNAGQGVHRQRPHLSDAGQGVNRQRVDLVAYMAELSERLRRVRVCCGDWSRVVTPSALAPGAHPKNYGVFLDPPYGAKDRADCYSINSYSVAADVRAWCLQAPLEYRIALCGYAGEGHEELEAAGWSVYTWSATGSMSTKRGAGSGGNNDRERIWFSPACAVGSSRGLTRRTRSRESARNLVWL